MTTSTHRRTTRLAAAAIGATLGIAALAPALSAPQKLGVPLKNRSADVEVFVRLATPSVAELNIDSMRNTGEFASSSAQQAQAAAVDAEQARFRQLLATMGATELGALRVGANGLRVRLPARQVASLRSLPGVRSVGRVERHRPDNAESVPSIGAPEVWERFGARGQGIKIGIIDTGIDYLHANFGGAGDPADYEANDPNVVEDDTFPTAKVKGGFDFAGPTYDADDPTTAPQPDPDPLDVIGHGSHVAGTAAGIGVPDSIGPGVAPRAFLYALKVFSDAGGSTNLTSDAIEWALDPNGDGDMSDRLDVLNLSLGSPFGDPADPSSVSAQNAAQLGVIVVASAGNENDVPYVTGAPAVAPAAISTAAVTPPGRVYSRVNVTAPPSLSGFKNNLEGAGPVQLKDVAPLSGTLVEGVPLDGCADLTNAGAVSGNLVLIIRGTCGFIDKYLNAQEAGARAIIVYNDGADPSRIEPIVMGGLTDEVRIPGVMISFTDGAAIADVATTKADSPVQVTLDVAADPARDDQIAGFSSRGPGHGGSQFKPDLSAPGVAIVSTGVGTGTGAENMQGTSMAAPHVAGAAALLRELRPKLDPAGIKALLQNSTIDANPSDDTSLARQGVGVVRVSQAANLTSYASPGGVSFGRLNPIVPINVSEQVQLRNVGGQSRTFQVTHRPQQTYPGVAVECPRSVDVGPHGASSFRIRLRFDPNAARLADEFDNASVSQREVDGWCLLDDGKDTLRVGYLAVVDSASQVTVSTQSGRVHLLRNGGPALGFAEGFTLLARSQAGPGGASHTFDEIGVRSADPAVYGFPVAEFGISLNERYEHISNLVFEILVDTDRDGIDDAVLVAADLSVFLDVDPGTFVTAQFPLDGSDGFLDWIVSGWDFNDRTAILPFTKAAGGGLVPDRFDFRALVASRDDTVDELSGRADFARELVPDLNSFLLDKGVEAEVRASGRQAGALLWLLPNNRLGQQSVAERIAPTRTR